MSIWKDVKQVFAPKPFAAPIVVVETDPEEEAFPVAEKLVYKIGESKKHPGSWLVEAQDMDGTYWTAIFIGPKAQQRANEYRESINASNPFTD